MSLALVAHSIATEAFPLAFPTLSKTSNPWSYDRDTQLDSILDAVLTFPIVPVSGKREQAFLEPYTQGANSPESPSGSVLFRQYHSPIIAYGSEEWVAFMDTPLEILEMRAPTIHSPKPVSPMPHLVEALERSVAEAEETLPERATNIAKEQHRGTAATPHANHKLVDQTKLIAQFRAMSMNQDSTNKWPGVASPPSGAGSWNATYTTDEYIECIPQLMASRYQPCVTHRRTPGAHLQPRAIAA